MYECQDLLEADWAVRSESGPADVAAAASSCSLRASSVAQGEREENCPQQTGERSAALCKGAAWSNTHTAAGQTVAVGLRQLSSSSSSSSARPHSPCPATLNNSLLHVASEQSHGNTAGPLKPREAPDDFDEWDVDFADLDECNRQMGQPPHPPAPTPPAPAKVLQSLQPPPQGGIQTRPDQCLRPLSTAHQASGSSSLNVPPRTFTTPRQSPNPRPGFQSALPQSPNLFSTPSPIARPLNRPQRPWVTPGPSPQTRALFETFSAAPSSSPSPTAHPHPLRTPVLTNRLVQLVSASNKPSSKRPRSESHRPRTRRFPGPAGLLPEQVSPSQHFLCERCRRLNQSNQITCDVTLINSSCYTAALSFATSAPLKLLSSKMYRSHAWLSRVLPCNNLFSQPQGQIPDQVVVSAPLIPAHGAVARLADQVRTRETNIHGILDLGLKDHDVNSSQV